MEHIDEHIKTDSEETKKLDPDQPFHGDVDKYMEALENTHEDLDELVHQMKRAA